MEDPVKTTDRVCFICKDGGELMVCDFKTCPRVYHEECLGMTWPDVKWFCPAHKCQLCRRSTKLCCEMCPRAYCSVHIGGNLTMDANGSIYCPTHSEDPPSVLAVRRWLLDNPAAVAESEPPPEQLLLSQQPVVVELPEPEPQNQVIHTNEDTFQPQVNTTDEAPQQQKKHNKQLKKARVIQDLMKTTDRVCFICKDGGELMVCDFKTCPRVYHEECLGMTWPDVNWFCPAHKCQLCRRSTKLCCEMCPRAFCSVHIGGNLTMDANGSIYCPTHKELKAEPELKPPVEQQILQQEPEPQSQVAQSNEDTSQQLVDQHTDWIIKQILALGRLTDTTP